MTSLRRSLIVALAVVAAVVAAVFFLRRGTQPGNEEATSDLLLSRFFVSDSLGMSLRLPESKRWVLRRGRGGTEPVVSATCEGEAATVRVFASPITADLGDLEAVLRRRQAEMAGKLGVKNLDDVIEAVLRNEKQVIDGSPALQWQASSVPIESAGEKAQRIVFMWQMVKRPARVFECIGLVRVPSKASDQEMAEADILLQDVVFILQSFQVR